MISDKVISISELRNNATKIISGLKNSSEKYILVHNKPKAVLMDSDVYEFLELKGEIPTKDDIIDFKKSSHWEDWVEAFSFLETLKK